MVGLRFESRPTNCPDSSLNIVPCGADRSPGSLQGESGIRVHRLGLSWVPRGYFDASVCLSVNGDNTYLSELHKAPVLSSRPSGHTVPDWGVPFPPSFLCNLLELLLRGGLPAQK